MKAEIHEINCTCCKEKSPEAKLILAEINAVIDSINPSPIEKERDATIRIVEEYKAFFSPIGDITPLINLTKEVFSLPEGDLNFDLLALTDPQKKIGSFLARDISENPGIDLTKLIDFSKVDVSKFKNLKIALTIPTIVATLALKFGPLSVGITFRIGIKSFSWAPEVKFSGPKDAIAALKGQTYKKLLSEADSPALKEIKAIAKKQFADNAPLSGMLQASTSKTNFFEIASAQGVNITEDIDVSKAAELLYKLGVDYQSTLEVASLPSPETTNVSDFVKVDLCPEKALSPSPFSSSEIGKVRDAICEPVLEPAILPVIDIPNVVLPSQNDEIAKTQKFLSEIKQSSDSMIECAKKKQEELTRWYFLYEIKILNSFTQVYFESLRDAIESFYGGVTSILKDRDSKINDLLLQISNSKPLYTNIDEYNQSPRSTLAGFAFVNQNNISIAGLIKQNFLVGTSPPASSLVTDEQKKAEKKRQEGFRQRLRELQTIEKKYDAYKSTLQKLFTTDKGLSNSQKQSTIEKARKPLYAKVNPISNLVGYVVPKLQTTPGYVAIASPKSIWQIGVNSSTFKKVNDLWKLAKNAPGTPEMSGVSGVSAPLENYVTVLDLPAYDKKGNLTTDRTGLLETKIWKKFYAAERYDAFFTYDEQGYNQPKPLYDIKGKLVGKAIRKKITKPDGKEVIVEMPENSDTLEIDGAKAEAFWETVEDRLRTRIQEIADTLISGSDASSFKTNIYDAAKAEAALVFFDAIENRGFLSDPRAVQGISHVKDFRRKAYVVDQFNAKLADELVTIQKSIDSYQACIDDNQKSIIAKAKALGASNGLESDNIKKECKKTLGSDPTGSASSGKCPSYTKDCYWKEYTKLMQKVSLMPIPELDPQNLAARLFRYYPVGIQIPVPTPIPAVLPTLALGIPDPLISIPLPLIWKHIITVPTPLGTLVIWIALAGPIPSPFIMLIDEKLEATFMLTSRGPCSIPHSTVAGVNELEKKSLLEIVLPDALLKIDTSSVLGKLLCGSNKNDSADPDSAKNVIDKFKEKIKSSFDQLEISDIGITAGLSPAAQANKKRIRDAFEVLPPNETVIRDALNEVTKKVTDSIDKIKISGIKFPKDDKKLIVPVLGPAEILDQLTKAIDTAASAPGSIANQVLKDLGLGIKTINVTQKLKEKILQKVDKPSIRNFFKEIDEDIDAIEAKYARNPESLEEEQERIRERVVIIKKMIKKPLQEVADEIDPKLLGFISKALNLPPLPFPCYTSVTLPPVPPYVYLIIAAIKAAPNIIDTFPDETIVSLVSFEVNLGKPLPNAEKLFYKTVNGLLEGIPVLELPDALSDNMFKQTIEMIKQIPFKFKVRLPKPGLPTQIEIPGSLVKSIMKQAAGLAINSLSAIVLAKLAEAIRENKLEKIIAISIIIKGLFGASLEEIKGADIKSFISGLLESAVYPALDQLSSIINAATKLKANYLSVIELFQFPPKLSLPGKDGPFYEIGTEQLKALVDPIINSVLPILFAGLPYPVTLLACSSSVSRLAFTKIHPLKPKEIVPSWEGLTLKNVPFVIWLDQLIATAQRKSGLGSTYLVSSGGYQAIP